MDWQARRCRRAKYENIAVVGLDYTDDEVIFQVRGLGDEYTVVINQDSDLFEVASCDSPSVFLGPPSKYRLRQEPNFIVKHTTM